jgi:tubulin polyglutamylase TTLL6/13
MHLTNYAINKNSKNFVKNSNADDDDVGNKRSLTWFYKYLEDLGHDTTAMIAKISQIITKTICMVQPTLAHSVKTCQPDDYENGMCFEVLGFDIMLDHKLNPILIEVNSCPSFATDSPLD